MKRQGVILPAIFVLACAPQMRTTMLGESRAPEVESHEILVFSTKMPECSFDEIALVSAASRDFPQTAMDDLLVALKQRARQLGGHALVGLAERPRTKAEGPSLVGTVIRFTSDGCRPVGAD